MANEPITQPSALTTKGFSRDVVFSVVTDNISSAVYTQESVDLIEFVLGKDWSSLSPEIRLAEAEQNQATAVKAIVAQHPEWSPVNLPKGAKLLVEQGTVFLTSQPSDAVAIKQTLSNVPTEEPFKEMNEISVNDAGNKQEARPDDAPPSAEALRVGILNLLAARTTQLVHPPKAEEKPVVEASELPSYLNTSADNFRTPQEYAAAWEAKLNPITQDASAEQAVRDAAPSPSTKYADLSPKGPLVGDAYQVGNFTFGPLSNKQPIMASDAAAVAKEASDAAIEEVILGAGPKDPAPESGPVVKQPVLKSPAAPQVGHPTQNPLADPVSETLTEEPIIIGAGEKPAVPPPAPTPQAHDSTDQNKHYENIIAHYVGAHGGDAWKNKSWHFDNEKQQHSFYVASEKPGGALNEIFVTNDFKVNPVVAPGSSDAQTQETLKRAIIAAARLHHGNISIESASPAMRQNILAITKELAEQGAFFGIDGQPLRDKQGNVMTAIKLDGVAYKFPEPQPKSQIPTYAGRKPLGTLRAPSTPPATTPAGATNPTPPTPGTAPAQQGGNRLGWVRRQLGLGPSR